MQQLRFYYPQWLYSTYFGWQSHPSSGVHMLYMARGKPAHIQHMYSWWWVRLSPETCRVKPLRRIKTQLLHLVGLISLQDPHCFLILGAFVKLWRTIIRLSVRTEQFDCHWKDFHQILNLNIFLKSFEKFQNSLKSNMNKRYFTWRPIYIFDHI